MGISFMIWILFGSLITSAFVRRSTMPLEDQFDLIVCLILAIVWPVPLACLVIDWEQNGRHLGR
jgi:hypothetical protein